MTLWIRCSADVYVSVGGATEDTLLNQRKKAPRGPRTGFLGRSSMAESAGLRVSALKCREENRYRDGDCEIACKAGR